MINTTYNFLLLHTICLKSADWSLCLVCGLQFRPGGSSAQRCSSCQEGRNYSYITHKYTVDCNYAGSRKTKAHLSSSLTNVHRAGSISKDVPPEQGRDEMPSTKDRIHQRFLGKMGRSKSASRSSSERDSGFKPSFERLSLHEKSSMGTAGVKGIQSLMSLSGSNQDISSVSSLSSLSSLGTISQPRRHSFSKVETKSRQGQGHLRVSQGKNILVKVQNTKLTI